MPVESNRTGDSLEDLAEEYDLTVDELEEVLRRARPDDECRTENASHLSRFRCHWALVIRIVEGLEIERLIRPRTTVLREFDCIEFPPVRYPM